MSEYVKVATIDQLTPGHGLLVRAKGQDIALFNVEGAVYAVDNSCPHSRGPLSEGHLSGAVVTCPWHGAQFDITSGQCQRGPATTAVATYSVWVEGHDLLVEVRN